jgi:hypothetical protein
MVTNGDDCDDSDPSGLGNRTDADDDGTPSYCLDTLLDARFKDCDDDDPSRHPRAEDVPFDGIDANCDSADFPLSYGCEEPTAPDPSELTPRDGCDGPDLFIAALSDCWKCDFENGGVVSYLDVIVGNRGTEPTEARLHFDGLIADFDLGMLAPLGETKTVRVQAPLPELLPVRIVALDGRENCVGAADSATLEYRLFCDPG